MKYTMICLAGFVGLCILSCKNFKHNDSVNIANDKNDTVPSVKEDVAEFLVKIADARMMGKKEGELAVQKGTTPEIVNYGKLMIKDQALLLQEIQMLAAASNIVLPTEISNAKKDGFENLNDKTGESFDDKFVKMMRIDHERDIKDFTKASELTDKKVTDFAAKYLPMIQSHLDKLNAINN